MGRSPCCEESGVKKGPWTPEEDEKLIDYISKKGHGSWRTLAKRAGLNRCGKSCRLRWTNYLRPDIKRGKFTEQEETLIINLHSVLGNKWSKIASHLPGRTDNEIKNFWNTQIRKKLLQMGIDPETHKPRTDFNHLMNLSQLLIGMPNFGNNTAMNTNNWGNNNPIGLQGGDVAQLAKLQLLQNLLQIMSSNNSSSLFNIGNNNNNPYLLENSSLNHHPLSFNTAYLNGSNSTLQTMEPLVLKHEDYVNPAGGIFSQLGHISDPSYQNGGSDPQQDLDYSKISSILHENQAGINPLPALVSSFPGTGTFNQNQMDSNSCCNTSAQTSTHESPNYSNTAFDDWEKFLEDETRSGSYWKEILELTSTSASQIRGREIVGALSE